MENKYYKTAMMIRKKLLENLEQASRQSDVQAFTLKYITDVINDTVLEVGYDLFDEQVEETKDYQNC